MKVLASHIRYFIVLTAGILCMACGLCSAKVSKQPVIPFSQVVFSIQNTAIDNQHPDVISVDAHDHDSHLSLREKYKCQAFLKGDNALMVKSLLIFDVVSDKAASQKGHSLRPYYYTFLFRYMLF